MKTYTFLRLGKIGRLGNQLWQVAATLDRALKEECGAAIPPKWAYRPYLSLPEEVYRVVPGAVEMEFEPEGPYYQELQFLSTVQYRLREWYAPSALAQARLGDTFTRLLWLTGSKHCTAMHVRRTDYLEVADRFPQLTQKYRVEAASMVPDDTTFLVFSDDIPWCRQNLYQLGIQGRQVEFVEGAVSPVDGAPLTDDILDLFLMAECESHIIANSTFSWWGAFLSGQRQVIYPDVWFGDEQLHGKMWNAFPETWRQVAC